ncbi:MAG: hypothetical protein WA089_15050, partial [Anaerolineae bacterium]
MEFPVCGFRSKNRDQGSEIRDRVSWKKGVLPVSGLRSPISNLRSPVSNLRSPISGLRSKNRDQGSEIRDRVSWKKGVLPVSGLRSPVAAEPAKSTSASTKTRGLARLGGGIMFLVVTFALLAQAHQKLI